MTPEARRVVVPALVGFVRLAAAFALLRLGPTNPPGPPGPPGVPGRSGPTDRRRAARTDAGAGPAHRQREGPEAERRWDDTARQSVRRSRRCAARDLCLWRAQSAG